MLLFGVGGRLGLIESVAARGGRVTVEVMRGCLTRVV